jgi:hypothetical protein
MGWDAYYDLRDAQDAVNAAALAAAAGAPYVPLRVAPMATVEGVMREASALLTLPSVLRGPDGIERSLACADCYGDPARGEIVLGLEALNVIRDALREFDDALTILRLDHSRRAIQSGRTSAEQRAASVWAVARAIETARELLPRAQQLAQDVARLPQLLRIAQSAQPHTISA